MNYEKEKLIILLYHGVTKKINTSLENFSKKHMYENLFIKQMKLLKKKFNVISMDEMVFHIKNEIKFPDKTVTITFDDGFENNYSVAAPILDNLKLPATFYICGGIVNSKSVFWVDEIEDCINFTKTKELNFVINKKKFKLSLTSNKNKIQAIEIIKHFCKSVDIDVKNKVIDILKKQTRIKPSVKHSINYRKIKWNQIKKMHNNELFTIGSHSLNHEILTNQKFKKMKADVSNSINLFNKKLNTNTVHFSYPEGQKQHFNKKIINLLKSKNIICSPSAIIGQNTSNSDLFYLKRYMIGFKNFPKIKNFI